MSTETDTTSEVARVLGEHYPDQTSYDAGDLQGCMCGWQVPAPRTYGESDWAAYYAHQAAMLAEAGLLRDHVTIDALNERCRILVDEGDRLRAQIATQEPAGGTQGGSGDSRASGGLDGAAASPLDEVHEMFFGKDAP